MESVSVLEVGVWSCPGCEEENREVTFSEVKDGSVLVCQSCGKEVTVSEIVMY